MSDFHFSPRANRAHEIDWRSWDASSFAQAKAQDKPILLSISAVWCHWCHVMDETSYSDPDIIAYLNEHYIPVRVDNDKRPDVNIRYNQGGWPTTAFLTPDGSLMAGATYMPPVQMRPALKEIVRFYTTNRAQIEERSAQIRAERRAPGAAGPGTLNEGIVQWVLASIDDRFDEEYGGFGDEPKFPMTDVLEFLLQEFQAAASQRAYDMLARTLLAMSEGGMYDHIEGGFFRYSTTRDWSVPHFEKMTEDHAALLRTLSGLVRATRNPRFRETLVSALGYVRTLLLDPATQFFAGSQDADETYYAATLEERRAMQVPYVDRTMYTNWNAAMAGAFIAAGSVLEDDATRDQGLRTLDALHETMRGDDALLLHFIEPGGTPQVRGLLTDQCAYLRALIDAHELSGHQRFFERARETASAIEARFSAPEGGFYDHAGLEERLGNLTAPDRPLADNASLAESFLRLSVLAEDARYRDLSERTLATFSQAYERAGMFAAAYARSVRRFLTPPWSLVLIGEPTQHEQLREAALHLPAPLLTIRTMAGAGGRKAGAGFLCAGTACAAPAGTAAELRDAYESLAGN